MPWNETTKSYDHNDTTTQPVKVRAVVKERHVELTLGTHTERLTTDQTRVLIRELQTAARTVDTF